MEKDEEQVAATKHNNDRLKRDEWSEGAISSLLEAYEAKWTLRNRAKLKAQDWDDVAKHVSARADHSKTTKTQTQCKNKIESMKKRYRSETAASAPRPSWPLYTRLDHLLRGGNHPRPETPVPVNPLNSYGSNGVDRLVKDKVENIVKPLGEESNKKLKADDTNSITSQPNHKASGAKKKTTTKRQRSEECLEIGESIQWVTNAVIRLEEARLEAMRDIEKVRIEAEEKRAEIDLKRTQIIANVQLEIAKLVATRSGST